MAVQDKVEIAHILDQIRSSLLDETSDMHIKNVKRYPVNKNGIVLLDPLNEEDKEWYEDDTEA